MAMLTTAVALPLIASIIGAPLGIPLLLAGCKPLKDYFTKQANELARQRETMQVQIRIQRRKKQCTPTKN